jgi:hypothetical protein
MPNNIINASSSGSGGLITTAADSGSLELQSDGTTIATLSSTGLTMASGKKVFSEGGVLQVVNTIKTDSFSTSSTTFTNVTGLSVSITPSSSSNKILIIASVTGIGTDTASAGATGFVLVRDSTNIAQATGASNNFTGQLSNRNLGGTAHTLNSALAYLDSPATTSSVTYKIQGRAETGTLYINKDPDNTNSVSTITVMEIKG